MTEFQKSLTHLNNLIVQVEELLNTPAADFSEKVDVYSSCVSSLSTLEPIVLKYRQKVEEKNPDKQIYGEAMKEKVKDLINKFDRIYEVFEDEIRPSFKQLYMYSQKHQKLPPSPLVTEEEEEAVRRGREQTMKEEEERAARFKRIQLEEAAKLQEDISVRDDVLANERESRLEREQLVALVNSISSSSLSSSYLDICKRGLEKMISIYSDNKTFRNHLKFLEEFLHGIVKNPDLLFLRVVRVTNETFKKTIGSLPGSCEVLSSAGFVLKPFSAARAHVLQAASDLKSLQEDQSLSPSTSNNIQDHELYWLLEEPDSVTEFERWSEWLQRVEEVHTYLDFLIKDLQAHPERHPMTSMESYSR